MKKVLLLTAVAVLMIGLLAGCGGKKAAESATGSNTPAPSLAPDSASPSPAPTKDPAAEAFTISVGSWFINPNDSNKVGADRSLAYQQAVEKLYKEKYPNGTIRWDLSPGDAYDQKIKTVLAANNGDDVFFTGVNNVSPFVKAGYMVDLSDQAWAPQLLDAVKDANSIGGKLYGASFAVNTTGVFYNRKLFEENGLTTPKNWNEFISLNDALKAKKITPLMQGFKDAWSVGFAVQPIWNTSAFVANPNVEKDLFSGKVKFNGPELQGVISKWAQLAEKGYFNKNALSISYDQAMQDFGDGKAAMFMTASWTPGYVVQKNKDFQSGFFPIFDDNGKTILGVSPDVTLSVNSRTKLMQEAKDLVAIMVDPVSLTPYLNASTTLSAFKNINVTFEDKAMDEIQAALQAYPSHLAAGTYIPTSANDMVYQAITKITAGGKLGNELEQAEKDYDRDKSSLSVDQ